MNTAENTCQRCEAPLPGESPGGICPACLMGAAVGHLESLPGTVPTNLTESAIPDSVQPDPLEGSTVGLGGRYKILQSIGEGGFGTVYMAEQCMPVRRRVAIKVLKAGLDSRQMLARFESERQALAMMDHPNIAKVLDGGETEQGRPFFAMELVRGTPITEFCDREALDPKARLHIFLQVCRAVQHAHQKGIIHRDLKPANVLITMPDGAEPVPKVIDFGVAKAMETNLTDKTLFTRFEQMIGTPAYMSPEQAGVEAGQDVDTRADIYALGVLLYELLTGTTPFEAGTLQKAAYEEVRRILREEEAPRPSARYSSLEENRRTTLAKSRGTESSSLSKHLRGDLDWIVMKAIEKDRRRRYETANALARDVERHLSNEPVSAGPPTVRYRVGKYFRRNKTTVGIAAVVLLSLVGGLALATVGFARAKDEASKAQTAEALARRAEDRASEEARSANAINKFLVDDIIGQAGSEELPEADLTIKTALDRAAKRSEIRLADRPLVLAEIREVLRDAYRNMGYFRESLVQARAAADLLGNVLGSEDQRTLRANTKLVHALLYLGAAREALEIIEPTLELQRASLGEIHPDTLETTRMYLEAHFGASNAKASSGAEFVNLARTYAENVARVHRSNPEKVIYAKRTLAKILDWAVHPKKDTEIEELIRNTLKQSKAELGPEHHLTLKLKQQLAIYLANRNRNEEARDLFVQVIEGFENTVGKNSLRLPPIYTDLAIALTKLGDQEEADAMIARAHAIVKAEPSESTVEASAVSALNLAERLRAKGDLGEAHRVLKEAYQSLLPRLNGDHQNAMWQRVVTMLALFQYEAGRSKDALETVGDPLHAIVRAEGLEKNSNKEIFAVWARLQLSLHASDGLRKELTALNGESLQPMSNGSLENLIRKTARRYSKWAGDHAARRGDWAVARGHFDELLAPSIDANDFPDDLAILSIGSVLLTLGDADACRAACRAFMNWYQRTARAGATAKVCFLMENDLESQYFNRALDVSREMTAEEYERSPIYEWHCLARGMGEYRAGNLFEAEQWLQKAKSGWVDCRATAHAFHALVASRRGNPDLALRELEAAEDHARKRAAEPSPGTSWYDNSIADLALEEARRAIVLNGAELISPDATWSFLHPADGIDPAGADPSFSQSFSGVSFDDSSWQTGSDAAGHDGGFGYGRPVSVGWEVPKEGKRQSAYLRHRFSTTEPCTDLLLHLRVDDGVVVYLDGKEVGRFNVGAGEQDRYGITAEREISKFERENHRMIRLEGRLAPGEHVLALSVHNASDSSPDLSVGAISLYGTPERVTRD